MSFRKRFLLFLLALVMLAGLDALCAPFLVARGLRLWLGWAAPRQGLVVQVGEIDAPFFRPAIIRHLAFTSTPGARRELSLQADDLVLDLNFRGWIFGKNRHLLRSISVRQVSGAVRVPRIAGAGPKLEWHQFARLLPDNFQLDELNFEVATPTTAVNFRGLRVNASAIESGKFFAHQILITSPILRRTFTDLRGATSWESGRLTIAGIPLAPGLDLEALTFDLSRLARRRLGVELHLDTYGGTLRASFQGRAGEKFAIDLAGSASNISLAQISRALGFLEPVTGSVKASKFTFRGSPGEFLDATASIWMEATDFAWRARRADNVMLGATYYDRRLEVEQLYVRQRRNELTVNGELVWPREHRGWAQLPFRGQFDATIPDLNGFAQLFGATTGDFSGALTAAGEVDLSAQEPAGHLSLASREVHFRGVGLDSLGASIRLRGREATLEKLEARHGEDFLRGEGTVDLASGHRFSARLTGAINDLGAYAPLLPATWSADKISGGATFDWQGDGTLAAHSGTLQLFAHGLQLPVAPLRLPLDLTLEGSYSPQEIFFRTFKLAGERFSLGGFLMFGENFTELQTFVLELDGVPRASGTLFLPLSANRWRDGGSWRAALDEKQKFDVDLTLDHLNLALLASLLGEEPGLGGVLDGRLAAFGPLGSLQLTTTLRLENFGSKPAANALDFSGHLAEGRMDAQSTLRCGFSAPVEAEVSLPLHLEKLRLLAGDLLEQTGDFSLRLNFPAFYLETLPNEWRPADARGLLSGRLEMQGKIAAPRVAGEADLFAAQFQPFAPWPDLEEMNAHLRFQDTAAIIEPWSGLSGGMPFSWQGQLSTSLTSFGLTIAPAGGAWEMVGLPPTGSRLSIVRWLGEGNSQGDPALQSALVRGLLSPLEARSLTITTASDQRTFFLTNTAGESGSAPLLLRRVPAEDAAALALPNASRSPWP